MTALDQRITTRSRMLIQLIAAHPSNYWVGVVTDPALALFLLVWDALVLGTALHVALPCAAIGVAAWTIAEYAAHRWLYHARLPLGRVGHEMHHESPELLIGLPWFATAALVGTCWYLVGYTLRVRSLSSVRRRCPALLASLRSPNFEVIKINFFDVEQRGGKRSSSRQEGVGALETRLL